jgi:hypothetical protein
MTRSSALDHYVRRLQEFLPAPLARAMTWVRQPNLMWVRIPLGALLIAGGLLSFLPVLGIWMLPLGLVLIAQDIPVLQQPLARLFGWIEQKWLTFRTWWTCRTRTIRLRDPQRRVHRGQ